MNKKFLRDNYWLFVYSFMMVPVMFLIMLGVQGCMPDPVPDEPDMPVTVIEKPLTDWNKFYAAMKKDRTNGVYLRVRCEIEPGTERNEYFFFLVDGDRWYLMEQGNLWSCGGPTKDNKYGFFVMMWQLEKQLKSAPSDKAYFVIVGSGSPRMLECKIQYGDEKEE
jgi:hypothetical protein